MGTVEPAQPAVNGGRSDATADRPLVNTEKPPQAQPAPARVSPTSSPFPPIADYAFLSDCEVNCLVVHVFRAESGEHVSHFAPIHPSG
ncbi:MAG: hypothetical protein ABI838_08085 [Chloroflexota bacterium]